MLRVRFAAQMDSGRKITIAATINCDQVFEKIRFVELTSIFAMARVNIYKLTGCFSHESGIQHFGYSTACFPNTKKLARMSNMPATSMLQWR
jgi:hypothetical protein